MMGIFSKFQRKVHVDADSDRKRRQALRAIGRLTDGRIIDTYYGPSGEEIAVYVYTLNGVDFESSELLNEDQLREPVRYAPGAKVTVRYDPRNQGNSMLD